MAERGWFVIESGAVRPGLIHENLVVYLQEQDAVGNRTKTVKVEIDGGLMGSGGGTEM